MDINDRLSETSYQTLTMNDWKQQRELDRQRREARAEQMEKEKRDKEEQYKQTSDAIAEQRAAKRQANVKAIDEYLAAHPGLVKLRSPYRNANQYYLDPQSKELFSVNVHSSGIFMPIDVDTKFYCHVTRHNKQLLHDKGIHVKDESDSDSNHSDSDNGEPK